MKQSISLSIIISLLMLSFLSSEAQLMDTISKNHYYKKEIFDAKYRNIYNEWELKRITGGIGGDGYDADFDRLRIDSIGIFRIYRNDSLFIYGKITLVNQTDEQLMVIFDADTVSGGIQFWDFYKYINVGDSTLELLAPCCDRFNYYFTLKSQYIDIPDSIFLYVLIDKGVDTNGDSLISYSEAEAITYLDVTNNYGEFHGEGGIKNLKGIESFINLNTLLCQQNKLSNLDVSNCKSLKQLNCERNQLITLNVTGCDSLSELLCAANHLTELDFSKCTALKQLYCWDNQLISLNISDCSELIFLDCSNNQLTSLDISNNIILEGLGCSYNQVSTLDVSNNAALRVLECFFNQISVLDVSNNSALTNLVCFFNPIANLDVSNNINLKLLACGGGQYLTTLDVSNNTILRTLVIMETKITSLDLSKNTALISLQCDYNELTTLDISNNTALEKLSCSGNKITILEVSNNATLIELICDNNQITSLDISNNFILESIDIRLMPSLHQVCVWELPFPSAVVNIYMNGSPNIFFTTDCAPILYTSDSIYQPEYIDITSSQDGIIYLVPMDTEKDLTLIREVCIDSMEVVANLPDSISSSGLSNGDFLLYAVNNEGKISEPKFIYIYSVGINKISTCDLRIYPNPVNKLLTIELKEPLTCSIEITSLNGQLMYVSNNEEAIQQIDLSYFRQGIYFITVRSKNFIRTEKIVKL